MLLTVRRPALQCCVVHCRATPNEVGIAKIAAQLKKFNIHGLLIVGGFEVCFFFPFFGLFIHW